MDFTQATDRLAECPTHKDISDVLIIDVQRIRQARLAEGHTNRRPAPPGWEKAITKLAGARARELLDLASDLSGDDDVSEVMWMIGEGITHLERKASALAPDAARQLAARLSRLAEELEG